MNYYLFFEGLVIAGNIIIAVGMILNSMLNAVIEFAPQNGGYANAES